MREKLRMEMEKGLLALLMLVLLRSWLGVAGNAEVIALTAFKAALHDPTNILESWDTSLVTACTWLHVTCDGESVTRIDLGGASLSGRLVPELGQLPNLQFLELYSNSLSGTIPDELGNLTNLVTLDLYSNHLTGPIPNSLGNLTSLGYLRLNNNGLNGSIPMSLTNVTALQVLDLSNNSLSGTIPINGSFEKFTGLSFAVNNLVYPSTPPPPPPAPASSPPSAGRETGIIAGAVAAGAFLLFTALAFGFFLLGRRWRHTHFFDTLVASKSEEEPEVHFEQIKRFSLLELQVATDNFNPNNILGRGGFGKVYKGRLADGSFVAVKRLKEERSQGGELQFQSELKTISLATHQNLLKLRGFCMTPTERLLVYPYMANGSVASHLRAIERRDSQPPLEWAIRKRVALGAARGLAYLHEHCNPKIIHCDMKAANVLLDEDFEVVVGDFGLARLMDCRETHVTTVIRGTIGHISPEYLSMGIVSDKNDVFGYGIMLLELITGKRAFDLTCLARNESVMLHDWVKELLRERRLAVLVDSDIQGNYIEEEVEQLIQIALLCTQINAAERPRMSTVVGMLEGQGLAERWDQFRASNQPYQQNDFLSSDPGSTSRLLEDVLSGPR